MIWMVMVLCAYEPGLPRHVFNPDTGSGYVFNIQGCAEIKDGDVKWLKMHGYAEGPADAGKPDVIEPPGDDFRSYQR